MRRRAWAAWTSHGLAPQLAAVTLGLGLAALVAVFVLKWAPQWFAATEGLKGKDKAEEISRARTAVLATLAGLIAVVGAIFTGLSYRLNRAGQITERFTRAIDQLGSNERDVRLGGVYALERIAGDSEADHPQVMEVLTAYVQEHVPWPPRRSPITAGPPSLEMLQPSIEAIHALERIATGARAEADSASAVATSAESESEPPQPATDVQAAISVLGRRDTSRDKKGAQLRLSDVDLRGVSMRGGHFEEARLRRSRLENAHLEGARLEGAKLGDAHLEGADLSSDLELELPSANLERASLRGAHLEGAKLVGTRFAGADLVGAGLQGAYLVAADLRGADLSGADLRHAMLLEAALGGANLFEAKLQGAKLAGATLQGADLAGANLQRADLRGAHLQGANLNYASYGRESTRWPEGFEPADHGAQPVDDDQQPDAAPPSD